MDKQQVLAAIAAERAQMALAIMLELIRKDKNGWPPLQFADQAVAAADALLLALEDDDGDGGFTG